MGKVWLNIISACYKYQRYSMNRRDYLKVQDELAHFKNRTQFTLHTRPTYLLTLHEQAAALPDPVYSKLMTRIEREMAAAYKGSVYVALKWLGFYHYLFQECSYLPVIEHAVDVLEKLPQITEKGNFQQYIAIKLVAPYRQYLLKLAEIQLSRASDVQKESEDGDSYCMYNLIAFSMQELPAAIFQFSRYFQRYFPCLNEYIGRVAKDLRSFIRQIRSSYQNKSLPILTFLQVEKLEGDLVIFDRNAEKFTNCWVFPQTNAKSIELDVEEVKKGPEESILQAITNLDIKQPLRSHK